MNVAVKRPVAVAAFLTMLLGLAGCPRRPESVKPQLVEMDPLFFTFLKKGPDVELKDYDVPQLFAKAETLLKEGKPAQAKQIYTMVATELPGSQAAALAWHNLALCELVMDMPGPALEAVAKGLEQPAGDELKTDLELLRLKALVELGDWALVKKEGRALADRPLPGEWPATVHLYVGQAHLVLEELEPAQSEFRQGLDALLTLLPLKDQYRHDDLAAAFFGLGQVYARLAARLKFHLPVERMSLDMSDKIALMRQAEAHYLDAVATRSDRISARAGFELARLYEGFATDLLQAEIPPDLAELERQVYSQELNVKVLPFLTRASEILAKNASMCGIYRFTSQWCGRSEKRQAEVDKMVQNLSKNLPAPEEPPPKTP
jgi:tetratricopeptide (TPR) repeat protein